VSKPLTHLRSVLVATGALPARDEHFIQLERWATQTAAGRADPQEKEILHRYATRHSRYPRPGRSRPPEHHCRRDIPELANRTRSHPGHLPADRS
jgi:hypothetical protein